MFSRSVDGILSGINKKISQLHDVAGKHEDKADRHHFKVVEHTALKEASITEAVRAKRLAVKFQDLVA